LARQTASAGTASVQVRAIRIGVLTLGTLEALEPGWEVFVQRLAEQGYVEGENLAFEQRAASGDAARLPELAADLVALAPDVIFAAFTPAVLAAKQATSSIPSLSPMRVIRLVPAWWTASSALEPT
jgi:putative tryptophan/tyrosine transport system substrate-binding protein